MSEFGERPLDALDEQLLNEDRRRPAANSADVMRELFEAMDLANGDTFVFALYEEILKDIYPPEAAPAVLGDDPLVYDKPIF